MENRQNKPPEGEAASGHGGQKFYTDSEQAKLHKSKLRMESREERLNKARERLAKQKPPKKPGPIKRIARIAGHETHAFLHGKVYQEERDNVGVEGGHFVERSGEAALHYGVKIFSDFVCRRIIESILLQYGTVENIVMSKDETACRHRLKQGRICSSHTVTVEIGL